MADGYRCKWCGYQETPHVEGFYLECDSEEEATEKQHKVLSGYRVSFSACPGFTLSKRDQALVYRKKKLEESKTTYINHDVWAIINGVDDNIGG